LVQHAAVRESVEGCSLRGTATPGARGKPKLLNNEKITDAERVDAGTIKTANGFARIRDQRLAKEVEGSVEKHGSGRALAEFMEQAPEARVGFALDGVNAHLAALERKAFEFPRGVRFELAERGHKPAVCGTIEKAWSHFGRHGKRKGMKVLAMLDVVVHVFDDVLRKRRSEDTAVAESAMAKLGAALKPSDNLVAREHLRGLREKLFVAGGILVNHLAVVENGLDFAGGETRAQIEML